jgi:hypothetical protein
MNPPGAADRAHRDRFYERQRGRGEDSHDADDRHDACARDERQRCEARHHHHARQRDDAALRAEAVGEPAPRGRRDDPRQLRQREHERNFAGAQAAARQVEREVRHIGGRPRKEREVERPQPCRQRISEPHRG